LKESGDKLPAETKTKMEDALKSAKADLETNDADKMKAALEKLTALGAEFYAAAQKAAPTPEAPSAAGPESSQKPKEKKADVVDADFEVVDNDKGAKK
jgi:molecular chaperone DnaK